MNYYTKIIFAILKRIGSSKIRKAIWNYEFSSGKWSYLDKDMRNSNKKDIIYHYIEKYSNGGSILDLGCGTGKTGMEIDIDRYTYYMGVDISDVAIKNAKYQCTSDTNRNRKNEYCISDIVSYIPDRKYHIILFRESLYYINPMYRKRLLDNCLHFLEKNGVIMVRICDKENHKNLVQLINKNYRIIEKHMLRESKALVMIFIRK